MNFKLGLLAAASCLALASAPAAAAPLTFTATGAFNASWTIDSNPTPAVFDPGFFRITGVNILFNGNPVTEFIEFYAAGGGGGACAANFCGLFDLYGPVLFTGPTSAPVFTTGVFNMTQGSAAPNAPRVILTIANQVPVPATLALAVAGLALLGASQRRQLAAA
jgi:hypothetical protein